MVFSWKLKKPKVVDVFFCCLKRLELPRFFTEVPHDRCGISTPSNIKQLTCFFRLGESDNALTSNAGIP